MRIVAYIPARLGSSRVAAKNLRLLGGRPLMSYAIEALQSCRYLDAVLVNTESPDIAAVAREWGMDVYIRSASLATSSATTDEIIFDFVSNVSCDAVVVVNPTAPFLRAQTVDAAVERFRAEGPSALFSTSSLRRHALFRGRWLNFDPLARSVRTQDLEPVQYINFIVSIFNAAQARSRFLEDGCFLYKGDVVLHEMPEEDAFDIDYEHEFRLAEAMLQARRAGEQAPMFHKELRDCSICDSSGKGVA